MKFRIKKGLQLDFKNNKVQDLRLVTPTNVEQLMKLCEGTGFGCPHGTTEILRSNAEIWLPHVMLVIEGNKVLAMVDRQEHDGPNEHRIYLADPNGVGNRKFETVIDGPIVEFIHAETGWIPANWR